MVLELVTRRLLLSDATQDDVDGLLAVSLSNPGFTGDRDGGGTPDRSARDVLARELCAARTERGRHPLVVRDRADPAAVVGWAEVLDEHPRDHLPWIGLLELHADVQRRGYGREAVSALVGWAGTRGAPALRLGVDDGNAAALGFWLRSGFRVVDRRRRDGPSGAVGVTVMETTVPGAGHRGATSRALV